MQTTETIWQCVWPSPLGEMLLRCSAQGLRGVWFIGQRYFPVDANTFAATPEHALLRETQQQLTAYFAGALQQFMLPLDPVGTPFQHRVWQGIARIPYGHTCSYGELAAALGRPTAARALGHATGQNPLSLLIPCHRLLGKQGQLTGYAGGLPRKQALLQLEHTTLRTPHATAQPD